MNKKAMTKKGQMGGLTVFALGLVIFTVTIAVGLYILSTMLGNFTSGTAEYNATRDMITHVGSVVIWVPIIIVSVIGAGFVIRMIMKSFRP